MVYHPRISDYRAVRDSTDFQAEAARECDRWQIASGNVSYGPGPTFGDNHNRIVQDSFCDRWEADILKNVPIMLRIVERVEIEDIFVMSMLEKRRTNKENVAEWLTLLAVLCDEISADTLWTR
jgi:hypothetical protein